MTLLSTSCFEAAKNGQMDIIDAHLDNRVPIDTRDKDGCTMVHRAATNNQVETLAFLQKNGANFLLVDNDGKSAMHYAAYFGQLEAVKFLQKKSLSLFEKDSYGATPLHYAARNGKTNILSYYAESKQSLHPVNNNRIIPLITAIFNNQEEFALAIDLTGVNKSQLNEALYEAITRNQLAIANKLIQFLKDNNYPSKEIFKPDYNDFKQLVKKGHTEALKLFFQHCQKIDASDIRFDLIQYAIENCQDNLSILDIIEDLFHNIFLYSSYNERYNKVYPKEKYVVYYKGTQVAARQGDIQLLDKLLSFYQKPWQRLVKVSGEGKRRIMYHNEPFDFNYCFEGQTLLTCAIGANQPNMVVDLIKRGASPEQPNDSMNTPLHIAVQESHLNIVELLLAEHKVNPNPVNKAGYTPLHLAVNKENTAMMRLLLKHGANINQLIADTEGNTLLHIAVKQGDISLVKFLLENKADPNVLSKAGYTPLHLAAKQENLELINLLVEHGANNSIRTKIPRSKNEKISSDSNCTASELTKNRRCIEALERSDSTQAGFAYFIFQHDVDSTLVDLLNGHPNYDELVASMKKGASRGELIYTLINSNHITRHPQALSALAAQGKTPVIAFINGTAMPQKGKLVKEALKEGTKLNEFFMIQRGIMKPTSIFTYSHLSYLQDLYKKLFPEEVAAASRTHALLQRVSMFTNSLTNRFYQMAIGDETSQSSSPKV